MPYVVQDSATAAQRTVPIEGWNLLDPPAPIDLTAVTLRLKVGTAAAVNADGVVTRDDAGAAHTFTFNNAAQFQALAHGDRCKLIAPYSATGDGRMEWSQAFDVFEDDISAAPADGAAILAAIAALPAAQHDYVLSKLPSLARGGAGGNSTLAIDNSAGEPQVFPIGTSPDAEGITGISAPA